MADDNLRDENGNLIDDDGNMSDTDEDSVRDDGTGLGDTEETDNDW